MTKSQVIDLIANYSNIKLNIQTLKTKISGGKMPMHKATLKALPKNLAIARREAETIIDILDNGQFQVSYGSGRWKAIIIVGQTPSGQAIITEIGFYKHRPYRRIYDSDLSIIVLKRRKIFQLKDFCDLKQILPVICREMQRITNQKTRHWKYRGFFTLKKAFKDYAISHRKNKGFFVRTEAVKIKRGIFFSISELDEELMKLFLTFSIYFKVVLNIRSKDFNRLIKTSFEEILLDLTLKISAFLANNKKHGDLAEKFSIRSNHLWLHPTLVELMLVYGYRGLDRQSFLDFLDNFFWNKIKNNHSETYWRFWEFWQKNGERSIKKLIKSPERRETRKLLNLDFRLENWNQKNRFIVIEVFPELKQEEMGLENLSQINPKEDSAIPF